MVPELRGGGIQGITSAVFDAMLGCSVAGIVKEVQVKEGSVVKQGDVLVELESAFEDLEVSRRELLWRDKAEQGSAQAKLETTRKVVESTRKLHEGSRSISGEELELKELDYKLAQAEVQRLEIAEQREEIEYKMALEQRRQRRLTAPADGVVTEVHIERGEYAQPHQPLIRLVNVDDCYFTCNAPEDRSAAIKDGAAIPIEFRTPTGSTSVVAKVVFCSALVDPASGLKAIKLLFDNRGRVVDPGVGGTLLSP